MKNDSNDYIDLGKDLIVCEIHNRAYSPDEFWVHLFEHSREEVILLKKLTEKTMFMTTEDYNDFLRKLEFETCQKVLQNPNKKGSRELKQ